MGEHARLSPSAAERWMSCTGAPRMEAPFPDVTSEFAAEGTAMHTVREMALRSGQDVEAYVGQVIGNDGFDFEVTPDWIDWLQPGIDWLREQKGELVVEHRVDLSAWIPEQFGTLDAGVISEDLIIVNDFKGGRGVVVDAERNKQMMLYALGLWENIARHKTKATRFKLVIDQPRVLERGSSWETTLEDLLLFAEEVAAAAIATLDPNAPLKPSAKACMFCKAAKNSACYALDQFVLDLLGLTLDDLDAERTKEPTLIEYETLEPDRRSYVITHAGMIKSWLSNLHAAALNDALMGNPVPGFKAVATSGDRQWTDPAAAEEFWKAKMPAKDIYTQKLKSPAQMEKVAGTRTWAKAQELIHRPDGPPALVPESDKREALIPLIDLLEDLDDEPEDLLGTDELDELI